MDGYAATVVTDAGIEALRTGTRATVSMREQPELYRTDPAALVNGKV